MDYEAKMMTLAEAFEEAARHKQGRSMQSLALKRLADEVCKLDADKRRLNWLAMHGTFGVDSVTRKPGGNGQHRVPAVRPEIDKAMGVCP